MKHPALFPLALLATPAIAAEPAPKRPLDVRANATDKTTEAFVAALRAATSAGERVRASTGDDEDDLVLVIADVAPQGRKFVWSIDLLKANANFTPSRMGSFAGKCREDDLAGCAKGVIADTDRAVRKAKD